jgi:small multidrug resistance family-3 protein
MTTRAVWLGFDMRTGRFGPNPLLPTPPASWNAFRAGSRLDVTPQAPAWYRGAVVAVLHTVALFVLTALAEIVGCYLPFLYLRRGAPAWVLIPAALSLAAFAWLLTLHPTAAGRTYAAYGGVYVATAVIWLWLVDGQSPDRWDLIGAGIAVGGMAIIMFAPRT